MSALFLLAALVCGSPSGPEISFDLKRAERVNAGSMMQAEKRDPSDVILALKRAFAHYPEEFLRREVKTVYIVSTMKSEDGVEYGGTVGDDGKSVILAVEDVTPDWVESTFHHETAHLLMEHHGNDFPRKKWNQTAAPTFRYDHVSDGGYGALKSGDANDVPDPQLNAQGLLNAYGASCFDEDWATFAAGVIGATTEFTKLTKRYPRIFRRAKVVEEFYERVCPGWQGGRSDVASGF